MSTTVTYKGNTLATVENTTKTLKTAGKYMEGDVTLTDVSSAAPTLQAKTNIAPTTSSQTITPDSGYDGLSSVQINAMPTGTAGTPTATKGTVSNHSVSVTPSVTNSTGYITGGTKTGTAVSVTASELVSGTKSITENGTGIDVTNYASVDVNVSGGGGLTEYSNGSLIDDGIEIPANLDVYELTDGLMDGSIKAAYLKNFQVFIDGWLDADYVAFSASDTGELWGTIFLDPYVIMILGSGATEVSMRFVGFNYYTQEQYDVACTTGVTTLSLIM